MLRFGEFIFIWEIKARGRPTAVASVAHNSTNEQIQYLSTSVLHRGLQTPGNTNTIENFLLPREGPSGKTRNITVFNAHLHKKLSQTAVLLTLNAKICVIISNG